MATLGVSGKKQLVSPAVQLSAQPQSQRACAPPSGFVEHLEETEPDTHSKESLGCLLMLGAAVCLPTVQMLSRLVMDYQDFPAAGVCPFLPSQTS